MHPVLDFSSQDVGCLKKIRFSCNALHKAENSIKSESVKKKSLNRGYQSIELRDEAFVIN